MKRRNFFKTIGGLTGSMVLFPHLTSCHRKEESIKFGLITDPHYAKKETAGTRCYQESIDKIKQALAEGDEPVVIFIHQLLDHLSGVYKGLYVRNAAQINELLAASKRVLAVFQGHHHAGCYSAYDHIHYFTMPGVIEGHLPKNNSYAIVEILPNGDILVDGFKNCPDKIMRKG